MTPMRLFMIWLWSISLVLLGLTELELSTTPGSNLFTVPLGPPALVCVGVATILFYVLNPRMRRSK